MELKGSRTEKNLAAAFAGESQARNKYTYFASKAKKEGYEQIAAIFEETANNEKEHAKIWFKLLQGGEIKPTTENLKAAAVRLIGSNNGARQKDEDTNKTFTPSSEPSFSNGAEDTFSNTPSLEISDDDLPFF